MPNTLSKRPSRFKLRIRLVKRALAIWLILAASADAQTTTSRPLRYCYIEATNVSNSDELRSHGESVWGSHDREHLHRMALKIRVGTTEHWWPCDPELVLAWPRAGG
jgi:hypothetical protein